MRRGSARRAASAVHGARPVANHLARQAHEAGVPLRAVVADCGYGDSDEFRHALREAGLPFVMALKPHRGTWAPSEPATPLISTHRLNKPPVLLDVGLGTTSLNTGRPRITEAVPVTQPPNYLTRSARGSRDSQVFS